MKPGMAARVELHVRRLCVDDDAAVANAHELLRAAVERQLAGHAAPPRAHWTESAAQAAAAAVGRALSSPRVDAPPESKRSP